MSVAAPLLFELDGRFARDLPELGRPWTGAAVPGAEVVLLNEALAAELGLDAEALRTPAGVAVLAGQDAPTGAAPVSQAYAGHQFGGFSPRLGDGRAVLLGELIDGAGRRRDLHLKGSGRTPFARGGDGKAVLGPMLREYLFGEAMDALGIPTTRALAVVATGEDVVRERPLPGAVLSRVAASHLRVGTFQFAAAHHGPDLVRRLADHAIARHDPRAALAERPAVAFLTGVIERQAALVARWMLVGFVHGVMNTDNVTISGETIDYGPCAFMDVYDPATVFSSIDHGGRYAFGNQARVMQWNLARLAETLLPLLDDDVDAAVERATAALETFAARYRAEWRAGMLAKLGLPVDHATDDELDGDPDDGLVDELLGLLRSQRVDFTSAFRALSWVLRGEPDRARSLFAEPEPFDRWSARWSERVGRVAEPAAAAEAMDAVNPIYVPRNHQVERVLEAATGGDLAPLERFLDVLAQPFTERPGLDDFAGPAPADFGPYRTFCGT